MNHVRCVFTGYRRNDAATGEMVDCFNGKI